MVPVPKSNTRIHWLIEAGFTHTAAVKSVRPLTIPGGSSTYCAGLPPPSWTALPNFPATRGIWPGVYQAVGVFGSMNVRLRISSG